MPLTPNDVHNVVFNKPPVGKRGYDEDDVDAFLDLVEENLIERDELISELQSKIDDYKEQLAEAKASLDNMQDMEPEKPAVESGYGKAIDVLKSAEVTANNMLSEANIKSQQIIDDAEAKSKARIEEAEAKAASLESDAERKHNEIMASINQRRGMLETKIDQLQAFEKEYYERLKSTFQTRLEELEKMYSVNPND